MVLGLGSGTYLWRPLLTRPEGLPLLSDRAVCPSLAASAPPQVFPLSPSTIPSWSLACSLCGWPHLFQYGGQGSCVRSFCEEGWGTCGCPPLDISSLLCPQPSAPGGLFDKLGGVWLATALCSLPALAQGPWSPLRMAGSQQPCRWWLWGRRSRRGWNLSGSAQGLLVLVAWSWDPHGWGGWASHLLGVGSVESCLFFVSAAFRGTRRAAPHLLPLLRASSACVGGRPSEGRAAPFRRRPPPRA